MTVNTRVFVSYSWDSDAHRQWVRDLATRLRKDGVESRLDAWHMRGGTIPEFMNREVRKAGKVLVVCTPTYQKKVYAMEDGETTTGSGWEAMLISTSMFTGDVRHKVVPVLALGTWTEAAPLFLQGIAYFDLAGRAPFETSAYQDLLDVLRGRQPEALPIGGTRGEGSGPTHQGAVHNLPMFPRGFVGRTAELTRLHESLLLDARRVAGEQPVVAITGIGAVGKSELALAYAWARRDAFESISWVHAGGEGIAGAVAALADEPLRLGLPDRTPVAQKVKAIQERWVKGGPHLVVFDGVDHPESFAGFITPDANICVVVTTRLENLPYVQKLPIGELSEQEGLSLLRRTARWAPEEESAARQLGQAFHWLPLPLAVAGRMMASPSWSPSRLLARVERKGGPVAWSASSAGLPPPSGKSPNLVALFDESVQLLNPDDAIDALSRRIFLAAGWLGPAPIPPLLLRDMSSSRERQEPDYDLLEDALTRLVDVGLAAIDLNAELTLHPLVAEYARLSGAKGGREDALDTLAEAVRQLGPNSLVLPVPGLGGLTLAPLETHLTMAVELLDKDMPERRGWIPLRLAELRHAGGRCREAIETLERASRVAPSDSWRARLRAFQGRLLAEEGQAREALDVLDSALPILRREVDPCDKDTLLAGVALSRVLSEMGRFDDALQILEPLGTQCADPERPAPAGWLVRRAAANVLKAKGAMEEALDQLLAAIAIAPDVLGIDYSIPTPPQDEFAEMLATLAWGGEKAAIERVLHRARETLGPGPHAAIVMGLHHAGNQLAFAGRYEEALGYLEPAMEGVAQLPEPVDANVGATHFALGVALLGLGRAREAVGHLEAALLIAEREFGPDDPRTKETRGYLDAARSSADPAERNS